MNVISQITNPTAINLLYLEAYHNYTKSLYLCTYHDVVLLAGILMQLFFGDYKEPFDHFSKKLVTFICGSEVIKSSFVYV